MYSVSVDAGPESTYSGYSQTDQFNHNIFESTGLVQGTHTLKMTNANSLNIAQYPNYVYFDLDYVAVTGSLVNPFTPLKPTGAASKEGAGAGSSASPGPGISATATTGQGSATPSPNTAVPSPSSSGSKGQSPLSPALSPSSTADLSPSATPTSGGALSPASSGTQGGTGLLDQYTAPSAPVITSGDIMTLTTGSPRVAGAASSGGSGAGGSSSGADRSGSSTSSGQYVAVLLPALRSTSRGWINQCRN